MKTQDKAQEQSLHTLSEEELLGQFLPMDSARQLLHRYDSLYNLFLHTSPKQLGIVQGVGEAKIKKILCLREVMNRMQQYRTQKIQAIHGPEDVMDYFRFLEDRQQEELWGLFLNTKNHILGSQQISVGTINASLVAPREIFHAAVQHMAAAIIVVHNHPSGDPTFSREDQAVTERLLQCGRMMDIPVLDHIVIARHGCRSMKEQQADLWHAPSNGTRPVA